ncbi:hypothetical protein ACFX15_043314 [Malus domestica]
MSSTQHSSKQEACMPSILAIHEAHDLFISFSRQPGPSKVQEPKGHEPCGSPSIASQHHNPQPRSHKLPLALTKPTAQAVAPTTTPHRSMPSRLLASASRRAAPPRQLPRNSTIQEKDKKKLNFSYIGAALRR